MDNIDAEIGYIVVGFWYYTVICYTCHLFYILFDLETWDVACWMLSYMLLYSVAANIMLKLLDYLIQW